MRKLLALVTLVATVGAASSARADQPISARWLRLSTAHASIPCPSTQVCVWRKTDNTLHLGVLGADVALGGGGGGGTLATTYAAGASAADSMLTLDSTRGALLLKYNALGAAQTSALQISNATASNSGVPQQFSPALEFLSHGWSGSADNSFGWKLQDRPPAAAANTHDLVFFSSVAGGGYAEKLKIVHSTAADQLQIMSGAAYFDVFASDTTGLRMQTADAQIYAGGTQSIHVTGSAIAGYGSQASGTSAAPWTNTYSKHFSGGGTAPTKAAGACIGGTQTVTLDANATDASGTLTITGTATGTASSTCVTVSFAAPYSFAPHCQISPANAAAAALSGAASLYVDSSTALTASFVVKVGATALPAGTYMYNYDCMQ